MICTVTEDRFKLLRDVFHESKKDRHSHFDRAKIDDTIIECKDKGQSMLIYGGPYIGKSYLVFHNFNEREYILIECFESMSIEDVYTQILKEIGYRVKTDITTTTRSNAQITGKLTSSSGDADLEINGSLGRSKETVQKEICLYLTLSNPSDIIKALHEKNFNKYIVFSNFSLLKTSVQQTFASHLASFLKRDIKLVILYTALTPALFDDCIKNTNQLRAFNQDTWDYGDLRGYIKYCADWLNITFDETFVNSLVDEYSNGHFRIVRDACYEVCRDAGIDETLRTHTTGIGKNVDVKALIREIFAEQPGSYSIYPDVFTKVIQEPFGGFQAYLTKFSHGLQDGVCYKWILYCVITASDEELQYGMSLETIMEKIKTLSGNKKPKKQAINESLKRIDRLQREKCQPSMSPEQQEDDPVCEPLMLLDYQTDEIGNSRLKIVDTDFLLWLFVREKGSLLSDLNISISPSSPK